MYTSSAATPPVTSPQTVTHGRLIQTLLNLASPGTARYQAHRLRSDGMYRVVVRTDRGFQILSISPQALLLTELGILVESDRYAITQQLSDGEEADIVDQLTASITLN